MKHTSIQSLVKTKRQIAGKRAQHLGAKTEEAFDALVDLWTAQGIATLAGGHPKPTFTKEQVHVREKGAVDKVGRIHHYPFATDIKHSVVRPWDASELSRPDKRHQFDFLRSFSIGGFAAILCCVYPEHLFSPTWYVIRIYETDSEVPKYGTIIDGKPRWVQIHLEDLPKHVEQTYLSRRLCRICGQAWAKYPLPTCAACASHYE